MSTLKKNMRSVARALSVLYGNRSYWSLVHDTLQELRTYPGPDKPQLPLSKTFLDCFLKYGVCVTPRMFTKCEILCIGIATLDIEHHFISIDQKTSTRGREGYRGMAMLDPRVQRVLYGRLRIFGFANPRFHPQALQSFSSVVINGGGSFLQSSNWDFDEQSRFELDVGAQPFGIRIADTPGVLEANGLYVATKTTQNGRPVYVHVSIIEFTKAGFAKCIQEDHKKRVLGMLPDTKGDRIVEVCSPRVLVSTGTHEWGIQLLPGYSTSMFLVKFTWNDSDSAKPTDAFNGAAAKVAAPKSSAASKKKAESSSESDSDGSLSESSSPKGPKSKPKSLTSSSTKLQGATCILRALFDGRFDMQDCNISVQVLDAAMLTSACKDKGHRFSFGTHKFAYRDAKTRLAEKGVPGPLTPQGYHHDGPQFYDSRVYDEFGHLKASCLSCGERKQVNERVERLLKQQQDKPTNNPFTLTEMHELANPWVPLTPNLLRRFFEHQNDILSESCSALGAFFSRTYIETPSRPSMRLALQVPFDLGRMSIFTFHWRHRGKGDKPPEVSSVQPAKKAKTSPLPSKAKPSVVEKGMQPPVHARPHNYVYTYDPRKHPTYDAEATLEFMGLCHNDAAHFDAASQVQVMECLQTFTPQSALGHDEPLEEFHTYFDDQQALNAHIENALRLQVQVSPMNQLPILQVTSWHLRLHTELVPLAGQSSKRTKSVSLVHGHGAEILVNKADFDSDKPRFYGCDGAIYELDGAPKTNLCYKEAVSFGASVGTNEDLNKLCTTHGALFDSKVQAATAALMTSWCQATLYHLMCLLDIRVLNDAHLSLSTPHHVLQVEGTCFLYPGRQRVDLIPSFEELDAAIGMRMYTSRGTGTRLVITVQAECSLPNPSDVEKILIPMQDL